MTSVWLTSDLHIGHGKIALTRGYDDPLHHDANMARIWRRRIGPDDLVWVLGDISSGGAPAQREALQFLSELPGRKYLVAGNHDSVHPMHATAAMKWMPEYLAVFDYVCTQAVVNVQGQKVMLSHFPYSADHTAECRYPEWRLRDIGRWLLHGHTHSKQVTMPEYPKEYHVGWDAHGGPINMGEISKYIVERNHGIFSPPPQAMDRVATAGR